MLGRMYDRLDKTGKWDWETFVHGFIVITNADWRKQGVTAVYCWDEDGKWKILKCDKIPVSALWRLDSERELDSSFDELIHEYDGSDDDRPIPYGSWQFVVYCNAPSSDRRERFAFQSEVENAVFDPRIEAGYDPGHACLLFLNTNQDVPPAELVNENWPLAYTKLMDGTEPYPSLCKCHPSLFVHARDDPSDIEIVNMEWDCMVRQGRYVARSDEELMKIGRESKTTTQKCDADSLVTTLQQLAIDAS